MNIELITIKKDILGNGTPLLKAGVYYKKDVVDNYPYLNFDDENYFVSSSENILEPGTKVIYNGHKYYIISIKKTSFKDYYGNYRIMPIKNRINGKLKFEYMIASSVNDKPSDQKCVFEFELNIPEKYWFINSEGAICEAWKGEKPNADKWRNENNNMFGSKEDAQDKVAILTYNVTKYYDINGQRMSQLNTYMSTDSEKAGELYHLGGDASRKIASTPMFSKRIDNPTQEKITKLKLVKVF